MGRTPAVVGLELRGPAVGVGQRGRPSEGVVWGGRGASTREVGGGLSPMPTLGRSGALEGPGCSVCNFAGRGPGEGSGFRLLASCARPTQNQASSSSPTTIYLLLLVMVEEAARCKSTSDLKTYTCKT